MKRHDTIHFYISVSFELGTFCLTVYVAIFECTFCGLHKYIVQMSHHSQSCHMATYKIKRNKTRINDE